MNKTIITIVIVAVVLVGGYFLLQNTTPQQASVPEPPSGVTVSQPSGNTTTPQTPAHEAPDTEGKVVMYTDSGYSPSTITIKKGEAVTFKNQSSQAMWTASARHPTHREYSTTGGCLGSTFDTCSGIQSGGSWSFTFDIAGTWGYHNHLSPSKTGVVVVE